METIELNYGNKATINTGNYENISPMFNIKRIIQSSTDLNITNELNAMKDIVDGQLNDYIKAHQAEILNPRTYEKDGKKYVSVTQVITPIKPKIPNFELYGLRGDIYHRIYKRWTTENKYIVDISLEEKEKLKPVKGIEDNALDWIIKLEDIEYITSEKTVYNDTYLYAGTYDSAGLFKKVPSVLDLKSGRIDLDKCFMQLSAYAKCLDVEQMVILPIHPSEKHEPIISNEVDFYFGMFIQKRKDFKERYGL